MILYQFSNLVTKKREYDAVYVAGEKIFSLSEA